MLNVNHIDRLKYSRILNLRNHFKCVSEEKLGSFHNRLNTGTYINFTMADASMLNFIVLFFELYSKKKKKKNGVMQIFCVYYPLCFTIFAFFSFNILPTLLE